MQDWMIMLVRAMVMFVLTVPLIRLLGRGSLSRITPYKFVNYTIIALMITLISLGLVTNITHSIILLGVWISFFDSFRLLILKE